ncbi:MAG: 2OG-Fe(II) oxygenase [Pacificimonas sp.]
MTAQIDVAARLKAMRGVQRTPTPRLDLFRLRGFLSPVECAALIGMIEAERRPSTIADDADADNAYRTSETCDFDESDPLIVQVNERLAELLQIDPALGEPLQGQRYDVGQEFKQHTDYFEPGGDAMRELRAEVGQRTWTAMCYLNEPEAGGATRFKVIRKSVQPETGALLTWNNRRPDSSVNPATMHIGMKVRKGLKYVITKWYAERPWPRQ